MDVKEYLDFPRINLTGSVGDGMIKDLDRQVKNLDREDARPVVLTLASDGGGTGYGRAIFEELSLLDQELDMTLVIRGLCQSAAVTIAMAIPRERRLCTPNTSFLLHEASRSSSPTFMGTESVRRMQLAKIGEDFNADREEAKWVNRIVARGCGKSVKEIQHAMRHNTVLVGAQAVAFGLAGGIFKPDRSVLDSRQS